MRLAERLRRIWTPPWDRWGAVVLAALAYSANVAIVLASGMHRSPPMWYIDAIPPAISTLEFGHPSDYTGLAAVRDEFHARARSDEAGGLNWAIQAATRLDPKTISRTKYLLGPDDKGVVDFVRLSFVVFGYRVEGFHYLYLLLLGLSVAIFFLRHWKRGWPLPFAVAYLSAHLMVLPAVHFNPQLQGVIALRFLPALSLLPFLDAVLSIRAQARLDRRDFLFVAQSMIFLLCVHMRSSILSQLLAVQIAAAAATLLFLLRRRRLPAEARMSLCAGVGIWWPGLVLAMGFGALTLYQKRAYAEEYRRGDELSGHVFWPSLYSGWAFQPELARRENLRIDDVSVMAAAGRYLEVRDRHREWTELGGDSPRYTRIRWTPYERVVREMYLDTWKNGPGLCVRGILVHKPVAMFHYGIWLAGFRTAPPYLPLMHHAVARQHLAMSKRLENHRKPLRLFYLAVLLFAAGTGVILASLFRTPHPGQSRRILGFLGGGLASALIVYPVPHTMGEGLVALLTIAYSLIGTGCAWSLRKWVDKIIGRE